MSANKQQADVPIRCVTVDVEEYFQIEAAYGRVERADWPRWPSRVEAGVNTLLELFERVGCRATFFFLGYVARHHRGLARRCASAGHEIACHGFMHDRLHRLGPDTFRDDLRDSKRLIEDQVGRAILGYRAPTWSLTRQTAWAVDVIREVGFEYDASIFPARHPHYGVPGAPAKPYYLPTRDGARLLELPPLVWRVAGRNLPAAGGGYFRLLPSAMLRRGIEQAQRERRPAILYFHPWEFIPDLPRLPLKLAGRIRTYHGLRTAAARLERILNAHQGWSTIADQLDALRTIAQQLGPFSLAA